MLSFPQGFFESETRCDFYVDSTMKSVWAAELEVLAAVAGVCEKYQLPWFAYAGTLLGAVRHNGFVPWDDDMDICMLREDFNKLIQVLPQELPESYHVYNALCGEQQEQFWTCVMNADFVSMEPDHLKAFHGCPFIVGIDIFPLDYIPESKNEIEQEKMFFELIWKAVCLAKLKEPTKKNRKMLKEALKTLEQCLPVKFNDKEDLVTQLWRLGNQICTTFSEGGGEYVTNFFSFHNYPNFKFHVSCFEDAEYLPFESVEIPVPLKYQEVLTQEYGDYMTPVRNLADHGYPFYKDQLEQMRERIRKMEEEVGEKQQE